MAVTTVKKENYQELMRFLELIFNHPRNFFPIYYPHACSEGVVNPENELIIKKEGRIVSHVGVYPINLIVDGKTVKAAGIGGVATLEEYRGKGLMSELIKASDTKMRNEGCAVSVLWGDRQRYGHFGYEIVGPRVKFGLNKRYLSSTKVSEDTKIKRYEKKDLKKIIEIHNNEQLSVNRTEKIYELILDRPDINIWLAERNDREKAYCITLYPDLSNIIESGGNPDVFLTLIKYLFDHSGLNSVGITRPYYNDPLTQTLFSCCSSWLINHCLMLKIINLDKTIQGFLEQINKKTKLLSEICCSFSLKILETGQKTNLFAEKGQLEINNSKKTQFEICLSEKDMARLIFGSLIPTKNFNLNPKISGLIDHIFPLDFYVWLLDHV